MYFLAEVTFYKDKRKSLPSKGYRPDAIFNDNNNFWGIYFIDLCIEQFDKPYLAQIKFSFNDEHYNEISIGQEFFIMEGRNNVAKGKVVLIKN